jgi:hypothetical protein
MTWPRFIGLIQTDGNINWFFEGRDKTFRPRITLSAGEKNKYLLDIVKEWLESQDIVCQCQRNQGDFGTSFNLYVERKEQVKKVINKIDEATEGYPTLLVDNKLVDFLALKHAFKRVDEKALVRTTLERKTIFGELADLKVTLLERNVEQRRIDVAAERAKLEERLEVSNTEGLAELIYNNILDQAEQKGTQLLNQLQTTNETCKNYSNKSNKLGEYIAGAIDGDGSFQVGFHVNNTRSGPSYAFAPIFSLTDGYVATKSHILLNLFNHFFGNTTSMATVGQNVRAERLYIKSRKVLSKMVSFIKEAQLMLETKVQRILVMEEVLLKFTELYINQATALSIVDKIETDFDMGRRKYSPAECKKIIIKYFESKNSG